MCSKSTIYSKKNPKLQIQWEKSFDEDSMYGGESVIQTKDGGYVITGEAFNRRYGNNIFLKKVDKNGKEEWTKYFGGDQNDRGYSVIQTREQDFVIVGTTGYIGKYGGDVYLLRTDINGNEIWSNKFGDVGNDKGTCVCQTKDGGFIITGSFQTLSYREELLLLKANDKGNIEFSRLFSRGNHDGGFSVYQTSDNGYIITGFTYHNYVGGGRHVWLLKTDNKGIKEWGKIFNNSYSEIGKSVIQAQDNGYIILCENSLIKTDYKGNVEWESLGGGNSLCITKKGDYILLNEESEGINSNLKDAVLTKIDNSGNKIWDWSFGNKLEDEGVNSICKTKDNGFIITGTKDIDRVWLVKIVQ